MFLPRELRLKGKVAEVKIRRKESLFINRISLKINNNYYRLQ